MRQSFSVTKDASIYEEFSYKNSGHDEILEVGKDTTGTKSIRSLVQLDVASISSSISDGTIPLDSKFELKLFVARADDLDLDQVIHLAQVSRSWVEGTGFYYQNTNVPYTSSREPTSGYIENNGVTWKNRQSGSLWTTSGSEFYTSSIISSSITNPVTDMTFDITPFMHSWLSGSVLNNGLILKFPDADELNTANVGNIRFFSKQTHTIYIPTLVAKFNNQVYITGSLTLANTAQTIVTPKNLAPRYNSGEVVRVDLSVRDRYPVKTFDTIFSNYAGNQYLPQTSYFSIIDIQSNTIVIPFDEYSKINCDGTGSYFNFQVSDMYANRYYKVKVKVVDTNYTRIFDVGYHFTIEQT